MTTPPDPPLQRRSVVRGALSGAAFGLLFAILMLGIGAVQFAVALIARSATDAPALREVGAAAGYAGLLVAAGALVGAVRSRFRGRVVTHAIFMIAGSFVMLGIGHLDGDAPGPALSKLLLFIGALFGLVAARAFLRPSP